jgi:C-terminal processing protease CtpA/Prc
VSFTELWGEDHSIVSIGVLLDMTEIKSDYAARILDDYAVLSVGSFILGQRDFSSFLEDFFLELEEKSIEKLVIDLRGNWGGTPKPAALLLAYLSPEPVRYFNSDAPFYMFNYKRLRKPKEHAFAGTVYVLMDGCCFSTTAHFISLLKHHGIATLVGEEAGGSASCSDAKRRIVLPNTGMRVYYSTRVFTTAVEGFTPGRGIEPDYRIGPTVQDIAAGRDPAAEFAAELAGAGERKQ